ncbi:MAG TPA: Shedu anti-phage system protein SduA domain-containing protein [Thermoanaerobaculia bacterium]|jgi:hypothetical protein|nr:Shedu anti-phage system protein SduA domain-containing protein [Thermoanaerobaculia bacterium]
MSYKIWHEADETLAAATGTATPRQQELGEQADSLIPSYMPRIVAAATLRIALAQELNLPPPRPISDRSRARLQILQRQADPAISPQSEEEADAWVTYLRLVRRRESLSQLKLQEGDIVETKIGEVVEISSIGQDGRVFFKGGRGFGAWPDLISVVARRDENSDSAAEARRQAKNLAARHSASSGWSWAKSQDLSEFTTEDGISEVDIEELESVIATAEDERPIQKFLEENGHLLTTLLGGSERYCLPQKRLGGEYVPDFIIGSADSLGFRWVLIELETPRSGIYVKDGLVLDQRTRKGVSQVIEWRSWLLDNLSYARRRRQENGLGLFDIRENSDAVVLVGRRSKMPKTKDAQRNEYRQVNKIQIHSYDWLLETLRGAIRHQGPPASNPYLIPRTLEDIA